jgi:hypothetical protein
VVDLAQPRIADEAIYQLARNAGFNPADATVATLLSMTVNLAGAASATDNEMSGLWMLPPNEEYGDLSDAANNARAAFSLFIRRGFCAWADYEASRGPGHTGYYQQALPQARRAANIAGEPPGLSAASDQTYLLAMYNEIKAIYAKCPLVLYQSPCLQDAEKQEMAIYAAHPMPVPKANPYH